jgi:hypothetical protein
MNLPSAAEPKGTSACGVDPRPVAREGEEAPSPDLRAIVSTVRDEPDGALPELVLRQSVSPSRLSTAGSAAGHSPPSCTTLAPQAEANMGFRRGTSVSQKQPPTSRRFADNPWSTTRGRSSDKGRISAEEPSTDRSWLARCPGTTRRVRWQVSPVRAGFSPTLRRWR